LFIALGCCETERRIQPGSERGVPERSSFSQGVVRSESFPNFIKNSLSSSSLSDRVIPSSTARTKLLPSGTMHRIAPAMLKCRHPQEYSPSLSVQQASYVLSIVG
jgi:hypothetical protein